MFATIEEAQAAVDAFVAEYNFKRPHQSIDDAYPADQFQSVLSSVDIGRLPCGPRPVCSLSHRPACRRRGHRPIRTRYSLLPNRPRRSAGSRYGSVAVEPRFK